MYYLPFDRLMGLWIINEFFWSYYNVSRSENSSRENEMDSPSFEGFHAQLNCKFTYGNKNITQLTLE